MDKTTGSLYVGGLNRLYHFNQDLKLLQNVKTGPVDDRIDCTDSSILDDNYNKAILIDYHRSSLIACGTTGYGSCQVMFFSL